MQFTEAWDDTCSLVGVAARIDDVKELKRLIDAGFPVDAADNRGWRPLHEAAVEAPTLQCLEELLKHKDTDVNWQTHEGETALLLVCRRRFQPKKKPLEAVKLLLKYGADSNIADNEDETPLLAATRKDIIPVILQFIQSGQADPNKADCSGWCPLHEAASRLSADIIITLLKAGARIDMQDECGMTPIFTAAQHGRLDCLKILLDAAIERGQEQLVDLGAKDGASPLMIAAQQGFTECVQMLLDYGANPNLKAKDHVTAVHLAVQGGYTSCLNLLLKHIDVNSLALINDSETLQERLETHNEVPISPLHLAVEWQRYDCMKILIEAGLHVDILSECRLEKQGLAYSLPLYETRLYETALCYSIAEYDSEAINILLEAGASCNATSDEVLHPLIRAVLTSSVPLIDKLIEYGGNINYQKSSVPSNECVLAALKDEKLLLNLMFRGADPALCFSSCEFASMQCFVRALFLHNHPQCKILKLLHIIYFFSGATGTFRACVQDAALKCTQIFGRDYDHPSWAHFLKQLDTPSTLSVLCRLQIRRHLSRIHHGSINHVIHQLQMPKSLTNYLLYEDDESKYHVLQ